MAIWDSQTTALNCPTCGDALKFDSNIKASVCRSCGNVYEPGTLNLTGKLKFVDVDEASEEEENKREYICDACGATIVTDENTAVTFCAFCGNPTVVGRRLTKQFRPDYVIPFKIQRDTAVKNFIDWAKGKKAPRDVYSEKNIKKITGLYVPFWLLNAECIATAGGLGYVQDDESVRTVFQFSRKMSFKVKNVPFDGCIRISNFLMEGIEPFDFSELRPYDDTYLPGYYVNRYDRNALDLTEIIDIRISRFAQYAGEILAKTKTSDTDVRYTSVDSDSSTSYIKNMTQSYALLPVWFLNYEYKGESYQIAINGQTGLVSGELPEKKSDNAFGLNISIKKLLPEGTVLVLSLIAAVAVFFSGLFLPEFDYDLYGLILAVLIGLAAFMGIRIDKKMHRGSYNTDDVLAHEKSIIHGAEYFDFSERPKLIEKDDKLLGMQVKLYTVEHSMTGRTRIEDSGWTWKT